MKHRLNTPDGKTVVRVDERTSGSHFHVWVDVRQFSRKLLSLESEEQQMLFIIAMAELQELNSAWWSSSRTARDLSDRLLQRDWIKARLESAGESWGLVYERV